MPSLAAAGSLRDRGAILAGRAAGVTARRMRRGGGTALPGLVAGTIAPGLIDRLAATPEEGVVTITGTNGKTTTTHLLAAIAAAHGWEAIANRSGSNLERGLVTAYLEHISARSDNAPVPRRVALLEVDEAVLPRLFPRLRPRAAVFLNLFRDQLDRYGEVDSVAEGWGRMLDDEPGAVRVLNVDDPSVAVLASRGEGPVIGFGVEDDSVALEEADHASDARFCPCGARFAYDAIYMGHVGRWRCDACGTRRPEPHVVARRVRLEPDATTIDLDVAGETALLRIPFAGLYSVYNTLGAAAAAHALGVPAGVIVTVLSTAGPAFGRQERFTLEGRHVRVLLAKNPAGMNELVRALLAVEGPFTLLAMLNDGVQDGQDVSWIYDADLERLAPRAPVLVCSGDRADDLALRCSIAGMTPAAVLPETERALDAALERTPPGGRLEVLATYTAMLDVRESLARRAGTGAYWERGDD